MTRKMKWLEELGYYELAGAKSLNDEVQAARIVVSEADVALLRKHYTEARLKSTAEPEPGAA